MQLFDNSGRYSGYKWTMASPKLRLEQPAIDYEGILASVYSGFTSSDCGGPFGTAVQTSELKKRAESLMAQVRGISSVSNIMNGVHLPILLRKLPLQHYGSVWDRLSGRSNDYGTLLRDRFMPGVKRAHWMAHPSLKFLNHLDKKLAHQLSVVPESRHDRLVKRMYEGHVVGIFFPMALLGLSARNCRELMATLPENFILGGGFDLATALVCYPEVLMRDTKTPELTMAALNWRKCPEQLVSIKTWSTGTSMSNELGVSNGHAVASAGLLVIEE